MPVGACHDLACHDLALAFWCTVELPPNGKQDILKARPGGRLAIFVVLPSPVAQIIALPLPYSLIRTTVPFSLN